MKHFKEDDISYTTINGVKGTINQMDVKTILCHLPKNGRYVETGSYLGCSAIVAALHSNVTVWAHDIWATNWDELKGGPPPEVKDYFFEFYKNVKANGLENRIIPIRGDSAYTLGIHDDDSIDIAFIDGDHSYEGCMNDLKAVWPKVKKNCAILIHDCLPDSPVDKAVKDFGKKFIILPHTCCMAVIVKD